MSTRRLRFAAVQFVLMTPICSCSLAGDFGFDPLRLGENPDALKWYAAPSTNSCVSFVLACALDRTHRRACGNAGSHQCHCRRYQQAELQNGRWAMLGVAGVLFPELLASAGLGGPAAATPW